MALHVNFTIDSKGITVPYPRLYDEIRKNHGFVDLRGKSDQAAAIIEGQFSPALKQLLVALAEPSSPLFSLGCDIGTHREGSKKKRFREAAGGYVQLMSSLYMATSPEGYRRFAEGIADNMNIVVAKDEWKLEFSLTAVQFNLDNFDAIIPSVWVWFFAYSATTDQATASRERLIAELGHLLLAPKVLHLLKSKDGK